MCSSDLKPCILVVARPYHMDPGIGHEIEVDLQGYGYPVLWSQYLPTDPDLLDWMFGADLAGGGIAHPLDIGDVWPSSYSANTNEILWGAKFAARMPWIACVVRLSSYECGMDQPTYFIADIAANHDGSLERAIELVTLAKEAGADCAKFQHFRAPHIVSDYGFKALGGQQSHQASWSKSVFETYADASLPWEWTEPLAIHSKAIGIEFMSAPYDLEAVAHLNPHVNAFKVGSGDVNWIEELQVIADLGKPVLIATGAADLADVQRAMDLLLASGVDIVLMQCNTNYTGSLENAHHVNLRVLEQYAQLYPGITLGLSDHTPAHVTVLGAIALGARVVEKHFTDDTHREGPDHGFSMDPQTWRAMVDDVRLLEAALGNGSKAVEANEQETVVLQRRCVRAARDLPAGTVITRDDLVVLRPAPVDAVPAHEVLEVVGRTLTAPLVEGQDVRWTDLA